MLLLTDETMLDPMRLVAKALDRIVLPRLYPIPENEAIGISQYILAIVGAEEPSHIVMS